MTRMASAAYLRDSVDTRTSSRCLSSRIAVSPRPDRGGLNRRPGWYSARNMMLASADLARFSATQWWSPRAIES